MKITDTPMMAPHEIEMIDTILDDLKPERCLEWGSGISSVYFPKHTSIKSWLSIEHNGHYVEHLQAMVPDNVQLIWVEDKAYLNCVKLTRDVYDFILIDGEQREECVKLAKQLIKPKGVILLHDADSQDYSGLVGRYGGELLSKGEINIHGQWAHRGLARFKK